MKNVVTRLRDVLKMAIPKVTRLRYMDYDADVG
jgi:hypothetical protein